MNLLNLYKKESTVSWMPILFMAVISGIANAALLAIINAAASTASYDNLNFRLLLLFAITFLIFFIGKKYALSKATIISENIIRGVRVRITDKIRHADLRHMENLGTSEFYTRLTLDTSRISESSIIIINACQSAIMLFFCMIYISILSKFAFVICVVTFVAGLSTYFHSQTRTIRELHEATEKESEFFSLLGHILDGFKELKVNRKKSDDLFASFETLASETEKLKIKTGLAFVFNIMFSQVAFYIMIALLIFGLPRFGESYSELLIRITAAILFITGPVDYVVGSIPVFAKANVAVEHIYELEKELDETNENVRDVALSKIGAFNEIRLDNAGFYYADKNGLPLFTVGPFDLSIRRGELLFIVGGNGSGKSTFLKLLTGLYHPTSGTLKLDNTAIGVVSYPAYRELFSIIFTDFHLFDKLYGLYSIDYDKVNEMLKLMELDRKTEVIDGKFTNIDLSTGQKKRLAMIAALLEDKDICVFDEWAADQDPIFREYYYNVLLKDLKKRGKTIIAVSHDDRYFEAADRVLKMEFGQFVADLKHDSQKAF